LSQHADPMAKGKQFTLQLYISGATQHSTSAVRNIKQICEKYIAGNYSLKIIDIYQQPSLAEEMGIIATPTLVKVKPLPVRRLIGDMSDVKAVTAGLDILRY
jgi:circadian clock protein KaiB